MRHASLAALKMKFVDDDDDDVGIAEKVFKVGRSMSNRKAKLEGNDRKQLTLYIGVSKSRHLKPNNLLVT